MVDYKLALKYAKLVALTENQSPATFQSDLLALGYVAMKRIYGRDFANYIDGDMGPLVDYGFIAYSVVDGDVVVAIRCTETIAEAIQDLLFLPMPSKIENAHFTLVAEGFSALYESLVVGNEKGAEELAAYLLDRKFSKITIAGHSLGGALATLLALDVNLNIPALAGTPVFTYGSPRVGGVLFAHKFNQYVKNSYRIVERWDPVQAVPLLPSYYHVNEKEVIRGSWSLNPLEHHHITTYIRILEGLAQ